jgi:hypothetical protein
MRLNEQRNRMIEGIASACTDLKHMRAAILRKMASPYGDGSRSNMVNAETDVLPRLNDIFDTLTSILEEISTPNNPEPKRESQSIRIW